MRRILAALAVQTLLSGCAVGEENPINNNKPVASLEHVVSTESSPIKRSTSLINKGNDAFVEEDYKAAITNYKAFFALNDSASLHLDLDHNLRMDAVRDRLAESYLAAGENKEAFEFLKESLEYSPEDREICGLYGMAASRLRDELANKLRKDENIETRLLLGETLYALGEFNMAEDQAHTIIRNDDSSAEAHNLLGIINLKKAELAIEQHDGRRVNSATIDALDNFMHAKSLGKNDSELFVTVQPSATATAPGSGGSSPVCM